MHKQQLVELVRRGDTRQAVQFAQRTLGDLRDPARQQQVDAVMALLMYGDDLAKAPMGALAAQQARDKLATMANQRLLQAHGYPADLQLEFYWRLASYADSLLGGATPKVSDV